jgi:hypothetical protein
MHESFFVMTGGRWLTSGHRSFHLVGVGGGAELENRLKNSTRTDF